MNQYNQKWAFEYEGILTQQYDNFPTYFDKFLSLNNFDRIVEIGTSYGGLTLYLSNNFSGPFATLDMDNVKIDPKVKDLFDKNLVEFIHGDELESSIVNHVVDKYITPPGKVVLLCDGGVKKDTIKEYSKFLKLGDKIAAHDFFIDSNAFNSQNNWEWMQITQDSISDTIKKENLLLCDEYMLDIAWGVYEKK